MVAFAGLAITLVIRRESRRSSSGCARRRCRRSTYVAALLGSTLIVFALETVALFLLGRVRLRDAVPRRASARSRSSSCSARSASPRWASASAALIRSAEGSSAVVNLIVLPMAFLTGAFGPTRHYPHFLRVDRRRAAAQVPRRPLERRLPAQARVLVAAGRRSACSLAWGAAGVARRGVQVPLGAERGVSVEPAIAFRVGEHERPAARGARQLRPVHRPERDAGGDRRPRATRCGALAPSFDDRRRGAARVRERRRDGACTRSSIETARARPARPRDGRSSRAAERWARACIAARQLGELSET